MILPREPNRNSIVKKPAIAAHPISLKSIQTATYLTMNSVVKS